MQGRLKTGICHYSSKLVQWEGRVKTVNLAEFRKIKHFFDKNDKNGPRVGKHSNIVQHLEDLPQHFIHRIRSRWWKCVDFSTFIMECLSECQITGDFQENLIDTMTERRFRTIFKEIHFRNSVAKPARNILLLKEVLLCLF